MQVEPITFNGIDAIRLAREGASAVVALHGAQVVSWVAADGRERLFVGERAKFDGVAAIRGGVPVIFPQFGERGTLPKHGFARTLSWRFHGAQEDEAIFELRNDAATAHWPHAFVARLRVGLSATRLTLALQVENTGEAAFAFTAALHTYLRVDDISGVALEGLQGCDYEDSLAGGTLRRENEWEVRFDGATLEEGIDRIYNDVVAPLLLRDGARELPVEQEGFPDAVVWNPGDHLATRIADLAPDEWRRFVCVEAGVVLQPEVLAPGESWEGVQILG
ncbi:MAG: D-hexose-6-phosphate mutarotase [Pseudoxanthomonas sp.]